jgi:hypothetical protein
VRPGDAGWRELEEPVAQGGAEGEDVEAVVEVRSLFIYLSVFWESLTDWLPIVGGCGGGCGGS